jgi:2-keto-4-pentenoate hydratase
MSFSKVPRVALDPNMIGSVSRITYGTDSAAVSAAQALWRAWTSGQHLEALEPDVRPVDVDAGYAIQRALDALAGPPAGWKIAATSTAGQQHIGATGPLVGRLYRSQARASGSTLSTGGAHTRSAEAEFAFMLSEDLPDKPDGIELDEVLAAVGSLVLAIEVPDSRFVDSSQVGLPSLVADGMGGGQFITGAAIDDWRSLDLPAQVSRLTFGGETRSEGRGANVMGDPRAALHWMANEALSRGWPLRAGDIILTGASAPPMPVAPGDAVAAVFDGLGTVEVQFTE